MASYLYDDCYESNLEPQVKNRVSDWDLSVYEDILDFNCTSDWFCARRGQASFA